MRTIFTLLTLTGLFLAVPAHAGAVITADSRGAYLFEQTADGTITMSLISQAHADEAPKPAQSPAVEFNKPVAAKPEPQSNAEAVKVLAEVYQAVKGGNWGLAAALIVMLLVYAARAFFLPKLNPAALPLVTQVLAVAGGIASALAAGAPLLSTVLTGLFVGAAASGLWEQVFKHVLPKPEAPKADAPKA